MSTSESPYYLSDGSHVLIAGATGAGSEYGGKSVLSNWWVSNAVESSLADVGVYINPKGLGYVRGARVSSLKGMAESYRSGNRLFDVRMSSVEQHERLTRFLRELPGEKIVAHDEAQSYRDSEGLNWLLSQGGNMANSSEPTGNIRSLVVTQRPWNLSEELRANMPLKVWVGPFGTEARRFFETERMHSAAELTEKATAAYHWTVTDGGDYVSTNAPVPEEYAQ